MTYLSSSILSLFNQMLLLNFENLYKSNKQSIKESHKPVVLIDEVTDHQGTCCISFQNHFEEFVIIYILGSKFGFYCWVLKC